MKRDTMKGEVNYFSNGIFKYYREYEGIPKKYKVETSSQLRKLLNDIFRTIKKNIINRKAGVCLKKFAYFFVWMSPRKSSFWINGEEQYNFHSDMHNYYLTMTPHIKFRGWQMDYCFPSGPKGLTRAVSKKIKAQHKYKAYPYSVRP